MRAHALALAVVLVIGVCAACGDVQTEAPPKTIQHYVALGDTFAAAPYTSHTVPASGCRRARHNYPSQVADALGVASFTDVSCTGADVRAATRRMKARRHRLEPQVSAVQKSTDLVTVQFGAYADDLYDKIADACAPDSPYACRLSLAAGGMQAIIQKVRQSLGAAIRSIGDRAPAAHVVVVGYPRHVDGKETCKALPKMVAVDRRAWAQVDEALQLALSRAARDTGSSFVDVYAASKHHGICSAHPWVRSVITDRHRGIALGPTAAGEKAISELIHTTLASDPTLDVG